MKNDFLVAYITVENVQQAETIGRALVQKRLAACVNFWSPMTSIYRWEGEVETASEVVLIAKTQRQHCAQLEKVVKSLHSAKCPCILFLPVDGGSADYLRWLADSTLAAQPE